MRLRDEPALGQDGPVDAAAEPRREPGSAVARRWRALGPPRTRRTLLLILLVAFGLRAGWVAYAGVQPRFASDPGAYLLHGEAIARGEGYVNPLVDIANAEH